MIDVYWTRCAGRPSISIGEHLNIHLFPRKEMQVWWYVEEWYDGPHYLFGLGPLVLFAWW